MYISEKLMIILQTYDGFIKNGNDVVIGLNDGVVFLEKGECKEDPIVIKVEPVDERIHLDIGEVFSGFGGDGSCQKKKSMKH
jgi:hypothetical protein